MASSGTVGILRALLTADASAYQSTMKKSADATKAFGESVAKTGDTAQKVTPQLTRLEKSFQGDKLLYTANNLTKAITNVGGAAKLTASEQARVNRTLTEAIEKYRVLGQSAPKAMLDLEKATRRTEQAATGLSGRMVALGSAVGSFIGNFASNLLQQGVSSVLGLGKAAFETGGQIVDLSNKLGVSTDAVQEFMFIAKQTGTSVESFATVMNKFALNLAKGPGGTGGTADLLKELGLEFKNIRSMDLETAFRTTALAIGELPDEFEQVRIGTELMGKSFSDVLPSIRDGTFKAAQEIRKLTAEQAADLDAAGDAYQAFWDGLVIITGKGLASLQGIWKETKQALAQSQNDQQAALLAQFTGVPGNVNLALQEQQRQQQQAAAKAEQDARDAAKKKSQLLATADSEAQAYFEREKDRMREEDAFAKELAQKAAERQRQIESQRKALESLGIVTKDTVNEALKEFATQQQRATTEGVSLDRVLAAQLPKLAELVKQAKASGIQVTGLAEAYKAAGDAALRLRDSGFDTKGVKDFGVAIGQTADQLDRLTGGLTSPALYESLNGLAAATFHLRAEAEKLNEIQSPAEWLAGRKGEALQRLGVESTEQMRARLQQLRRDAEIVVQAFGKNSREAIEANRRLMEAEIEAGVRARNFWTTDFKNMALGTWDEISRKGLDAFSDMLVGFEVKWNEVWKSIKQSFSHLISDLLNEFLNRFLKGVLGYLTGARGAFSHAFAGLLGGFGGNVLGGAGGGLLGGALGGGAGAATTIAATNLSTGTLAASSLAVPATAVPASLTAGGGFGATLGALATNPFTLAAAGGLVLGLGIWKKGWFRGGEEGAQVNPARDAYLRKWGPPGTGEGSGFQNLAATLTRLTGEPGGGHLFSAFTGAHTMKAFNSAVQNIDLLLSRRGVGVPTVSTGVRQRVPSLAGNPVSALGPSLASAQGQTFVPSPITGPVAAATAPPSVNMSFTIQAWDRADMSDAFRDEIIPRIKSALQFNESGLLTSLKTMVG